MCNRLIPMGVNPDLPPAAPLPVPGNMARGGARPPFIVTGAPLVMVAVPAVITANPDEIGARRRGWDLNRRWRRFGRRHVNVCRFDRGWPWLRLDVAITPANRESGKCRQLLSSSMDVHYAASLQEAR